MKLIVILLIGLSACQNQSEVLIKKQYFIFGTLVEVLVWHEDTTTVDQALLAVETELNSMHSQWHAWKKGRLHSINKAIRSGQSFEVTAEEKRFIQTTQQLSAQSLGHFNPAIGELINLWGFHTDDYPILAPPPDEHKIIEYIRDLPTMDDIAFQNNQISATNPRIWLDFGGVAKGYAIDKAIKTLKSHGITNAIVNAGGDLRSIGTKGTKEWRVAIRKPNSDEILTSIDVTGDESVFTSGNYQRYKEFEGKRYAHIINPKTGYGISEIVSATVITENGTQADAAATALIVAGRKNWQAVAQSMHLSQVLLMNAKGQCMATEAMIKRLNDKSLHCIVLQSFKTN